MTVETQRLERLYVAAQRALGEEEAATLMDELRRWQALATRADVDAAGARVDVMGSDLRTEMVSLRAELRGEMAELGTELRGEMATLRVDLRAEMAELGTELRREIADVRLEIAALRTEVYRQGNRVIVTLVPTILTAVGLGTLVG